MTSNQLILAFELSSRGNCLSSLISTGTDCVQRVHALRSWSGCRLFRSRGRICNRDCRGRRRTWNGAAASPVRWDDPDPYIRRGAGSLRLDHSAYHVLQVELIPPMNCMVARWLAVVLFRRGSVARVSFHALSL